jgi:hypothetical protein
MAADPHVHPPTTAFTPAVRLTKAAVDHGPITTTYTRAGAGAPIVLLDPEAVAGGVPSPLVLALAARFRVVVPELVCAQDAGTAFSTWLRGFVDGLGQARVHVVSCEAWALRALSFCITDPLRVRRLVLIFRDAADPALRGEAAPDRLAGIGIPILVHRQHAVALPDESGGGVDPVLRFLLAEDAVDTSAARAE